MPHWRYGLWLPLILLLMIMLPPDESQAQVEEDHEYIVQFTTLEARDDWAGSLTERPHQLHDSVSGISLTLTPYEKRALKDHPKSIGIYKDDPVTIDDSAMFTWGLETVNHINRNPLDGTGEGVTVSVIDTGIEQNHPNLSYKTGICLISTEGSCENGYQDDNGHGTHVAGIMNAQGAEGVHGVSPGAELLVVKAMNENGDGRISDVIAGVEWSVLQGADIINLSITTENSHPMLNDSLNYASENGAFLVGAAGNIHRTDRPVMYPARHPEVYAIAGVDINRQPSNFSSFGPEVHFAAPGEAILSTGLLSETFDGLSGYSIKSGTSMAAPFAAGVVALHKERYPHLTNQELIRVMEVHALRAKGQSERNPYTGYGIVQVPKAQGEPLMDQVLVKEVPPGRVEIELELLTEGFYSIYRNGIEVVNPLAGPLFVDYVHPGDYLYEIYHVNGDSETFYASTDVIRTSGKLFRDVQPGNWYYRDVYYLSSNLITQGFDNGTFRPYRNLNRGEAAAMIIRAMDLETGEFVVPDDPFTDVSSKYFAFEEIYTAKAMGIVGGYGDGTFRPSELITRSEVAIMLRNAWFTDYQIMQSAGDYFDDVHPDQAAYQAIATLRELRITDGFPDGTFRGDQPILRNQFARFLTHTHEQTH